jgi:hypothetical protein
MEKYLIDDYGIIENKDLTSLDDIVEYYKDCGYELFDCGQGYYEDEKTIWVKIQDKFYSVSISAEVWGDRQDHGDKLYYVESIKSITYFEIPKPEPKEKHIIQLKMCLTDDRWCDLTAYLTANKIEYERF